MVLQRTRLFWILLDRVRGKTGALFLGIVMSMIGGGEIVQSMGANKSLLRLA